MLPRDLRPSDFAAYPPLGREMAVSHIAILRRLPVPFAPLLLREIIGYDWKFPAERKDLERQFTYLGPLSPEQLEQAVSSFASLQTTPELRALDWVNQPAIFIEQMTAHLWASHQIEAFRGAAVSFVDRTNRAVPEEPSPQPRVAVVLVGKGMATSRTPLFRKLRPHGTYFAKVEPGDNGFSLIQEAVEKRAAAAPAPFAHWYIDGGEGAATRCKALTTLSYESIRPVRAALQARLQTAWAAGIGSEALRTMLAQMQPAEFGLHGDPAFDRFQISLLTEGSGTQLYSTTFTQWSAREVLRRAQPATLLLRFAPRQRERALNEMLSEARQAPPLDPEGSLRDADMGAYYTWINQQRLSGSEQSAFLVWFEDHSEAVLIAPGVARGKVSSEAVNLTTLLTKCGL